MPADDIKRVPGDASTRHAIRSLAARLALSIDRLKPPLREDLEHHAQTILEQLGLPRQFLGFVMVAVSNEFWQPIMDEIPFNRRLFLLPHCLSDRNVCAGNYDSIGLNCAGCGNCDIHSLKLQAETLGYSVIVAEGTSSVLMKVLDGDADAIFGVACLDSLEKSFQRIVELGVPHLAVPLLKDGCVDTQAEISLIRKMISTEPSSSITAIHPQYIPDENKLEYLRANASPRSYIPLLRETARMFQPPMFAELLTPYVDMPASDDDGDKNAACVQAIALDWLKAGGKRLRPFVTIAAYVIARHDMQVLHLGEEINGKIPLVNPQTRLSHRSLA